MKWIPRSKEPDDDESRRLAIATVVGNIVAGFLSAQGEEPTASGVRLLTLVLPLAARGLRNRGKR
jgi:hypothetical protein